MQTVSDLNTWTKITGLEDEKKYLIQASLENKSSLDSRRKLVEVEWIQSDSAPSASDGGSLGEELICIGDVDVYVKSDCQIYITVQEVF